MIIELPKMVGEIKRIDVGTKTIFYKLRKVEGNEFLKFYEYDIVAVESDNYGYAVVLGWKSLAEPVINISEAFSFGSLTIKRYSDREKALKLAIAIVESL